MGKSTVYFTDFRCPVGTSQLDKLKKVCLAAGIKNIDMDGKFVAIKMHFGELGNLAFLRPNYAKAVADLCKAQGGVPFLTDCNTLYPGSRKNALEHLDCANLNGFNTITTGCQILIGDGLRGTDEVEVPVPNAEYCPAPKIGRAIMDADIFISLTHFKGHESTGFGGAIKNIGMGCGSRAGKMEQHTSGKPAIDPENAAAADAVHRSAEAMRLHIRMEKRLSITTNVRAADAVSEPAALTRFIMKTAVQTSCWTGRWQNMRWLSVRTVPASIFHWCRISAPTATVMAKMMRRSCRISVCLQALTR